MLAKRYKALSVDADADGERLNDARRRIQSRYMRAHYRLPLHAYIYS